MVGRWKSLLRSSICCIALERVGEMKIGFVGPLPREGCSTLDRSIMSLLPMMVFISLGSVFGGIRSP
jgi:hypothetical protein